MSSRIYNPYTCCLFLNATNSSFNPSLLNVNNSPSCSSAIKIT